MQCLLNLGDLLRRKLNVQAVLLKDVDQKIGNLPRSASGNAITRAAASSNLLFTPGSAPCATSPNTPAVS
jgi:hypothetical protein